jgi:tetratricopeptide (TPR) repeat protein
MEGILYLFGWCIGTFICILALLRFRRWLSGDVPRKSDREWREWSEKVQEELKEEIKREENSAGPLTRQRDPDSEIIKLRESVRRYPKDGNAYNNLAAALAEKGDLQGAIEELRTALRLAPKHPVIKENYERLLKLVNKG